MNSAGLPASPSPSPRKPRERPLDQRESLLRASILDTALLLGVGSNNTVTNWLFNPVDEADEDADSSLSPSLTYASTATSEESFSNSISLHSQPGAAASPLGPSAGKPPSPDQHVEYSASGGLTAKGLISERPSQRTIQFDLSATPEPRNPSPLPSALKPSKSKLRKPRPDGYESDGGYTSEGFKPKKDKKSKKKKADGNQTEYESDGGYLSDSTSKKKKEKKNKKDKGKTVDYPGTDYESDGGYMSSRGMSFGSKKKSVKKSPSQAELAPGDESDGANMSEASTKKKRFLGRFRKKQESVETSVREVVPPVPQLPPMTLPIAERFTAATIRGDSFDTLDTMSSTTRTATPFSERTITDSRSSNGSANSVRIESPEPLTNPFKDAESVRSPSIDLLATFHRRGVLPGHSPDGRSPSPLAPSMNQIDQVTRSSPPTSPPEIKVSVIPSISLPKPKRNMSMKRTPPQISAPNTSALAAQASRSPVPLTITPPTPPALHSPDRSTPLSSSSSDQHLPRSSSSSSPRVHDSPSSPFDAAQVRDRLADVPHTPSLFTSDNLSTAPSSPQPSASPNPSPKPRSRVLAYYDLPPPSPPPTGPLPNVPRDQASSPFARAQNAVLQNRNGTRLSVTEAPTERLPPSPRRIIDDRSQTPSRSVTPLFLQRTPSNQRIESPFPPRGISPAGSNQRGRDAPFPTQPILPREESAQLVRRTSRTGFGVRKPLLSSAANGQIPSAFRDFEQSRLDAQYHPRSASALDVRDPLPNAKWEGRRSWSEYDDEHAAVQSIMSSDSKPEDVNAVLAMLRAHKKDLDRHSSSKTKADTASSSSTGKNGDGDDARSTQYFDMSDGDTEGDAVSRYSVWSANSRASFLDGERSMAARERFVKRVEAMYGKEIIPPVPKLSAPPRSGAF